ncbi:hypothetical protein RHODOSMS8_01453 [Rhodobiaceae bacterium]|nr:hypothetical protein RHODOSMS8_01453 [Rhodobiaceae bacterium]
MVLKDDNVVTPERADGAPRKGIRIRFAKGDADAAAIYRLLERVVSESKYADLPMAEGRLKKQIARDMHSPKTNGVIVAEGPDENGNPVLLGLLSAVAGRLVFVEAVSCSALVFYVVPEARNSRAALLLLKAFEKWSRNRQAYEMAIHVTMGREDDARVSRLLNRLGFSSSGGGSHFKTI